MQKREYKTILINGKQKRIKLEPRIDGMDQDEFLRQNADEVWLVQNEMYELIDLDDPDGMLENHASDDNDSHHIPFCRPTCPAEI